MNRIGVIIIMALILGIFNSCKKEEGEGGKATIEGKLYNNLYDHNGKFLKKEEAREDDVFIIYGDNAVYDDQMDSDNAGSYRFQYLRKGNYTVFAYSDCNTCPSGKESVQVQVEIKDKKEVVMAADLEVVKSIDVDDGSGSISGKVYEKEYDIVGTTVLYEYYKLNEYVYLVYDNDPFYFDRIRTGAGGAYYFQGLIEGSYKVYAFSDCLPCVSGSETKELLTQITIEGESKTLPDLVIEKR